MCKTYAFFISINMFDKTTRACEIITKYNGLIRFQNQQRFVDKKISDA